jgi:transposase
MGRFRWICEFGWWAVAFLPPTPDHAQKKAGHAAEQHRPDVLRRHRAWFAKQTDLDPRRPIFVDEASCPERRQRRPLKGRQHQGGAPARALRQGRAAAHECARQGHWHTTTFIGALRPPGLTAPLVLNGPVAGEWFAAWAAHVLAPTLRRGDIVILDNLPAHKSASARATIEAKRAQLRFLPPYSPDINPIEIAFSKPKALLRTAAARTPDALRRAIGNAIDRFTRQDCRNHFAAARYDAY